MENAKKQQWQFVLQLFSKIYNKLFFTPTPPNPFQSHMLFNHNFIEEKISSKLMVVDIVASSTHSVPLNSIYITIHTYAHKRALRMQIVKRWIQKGFKKVMA